MPRRARPRASFASKPAIPFAPRIASPTRPVPDAQSVFNRLSETSARRPCAFGLRDGGRASLAHRGRHLRGQGDHGRRREQHGRGESGGIAHDHAGRAHRRDRGDHPVHRRGGYLYISPIGGWDPQVLVGQRMRFLGTDGDVLGVVGKKPIHLMKSDDRERASKFTDLWVDIGATSRAEAETRVSVGDAGVLDSRTLDFPNDRIVSRSIDDRIGAFVVLEALRRYAEKPGAARVVAAATTQEEIAWHGGGAAISAHGINPKIAIVVDVTFATDHPNIEKKEIGEHKMGGGPILSRGALISPVVLKMLRETAKQQNIPHVVHAVGRDTSTNADAIHIAREGVATALVSIPNRYMRSPNEMVSLVDVDHAATLIAEFCRTITDETDLTAR